MLQRKTPMSHGNGFGQSKGFGQRRDVVALDDEVGEGTGSSFGYSKKAQARKFATQDSEANSPAFSKAAQTRKNSMADEVGEGIVHTGFGKSKARTAGFCDEVGEGVASFGLSKRAQTRSGGKFQDEVGEGLTGIVGRSKKAQKQAYVRDPDRQRSVPTLADPNKYKWGQEVGDGVVDMPKPKALRNQAVMDSARGRPCLLQAPYTMSHDPATTVACHGNWPEMGKGAGRKADDCFIVWGCFECHAWLDQGSATNAEKKRVHALGMFRQMLAWEQMAVSETEPLKFRNAAQWALNQLEAAEYDPRAALMALEQEQDGALELDGKTGQFVPVVQRD